MGGMDRLGYPRWLSDLTLPKAPVVHVYGCGESMADAPAHHPSIGINRAFLFRPDLTLDYTVSIDHATYRATLPDVPATGTHVVLGGNVRGANAYWFGSGSRNLTRIHGSESNALNCSQGATGAALNFAALFRPTEIHLWGFDFTSRLADGSFYQHPDRSQSPSQRLARLGVFCAYLKRNGFVSQVFWHTYRPRACYCSCGRTRPHLGGVRYDAPAGLVHCPDVIRAFVPPPESDLPSPWQQPRPQRRLPGPHRWIDEIRPLTDPVLHVYSTGYTLQGAVLRIPSLAVGDAPQIRAELRPQFHLTTGRSEAPIAIVPENAAADAYWYTPQPRPVEPCASLSRRLAGATLQSAAVNLAFVLGAQEIHLYGFDDGDRDVGVLVGILAARGIRTFQHTWRDTGNFPEAWPPKQIPSASFIFDGDPKLRRP